MNKTIVSKRVIILLFVLSVVGSVLISPEAFAQGLIKIADNVYSYVDTKNSSPQNSFGANAGIIIGKDGIVVVDTLISSKEAKRFIRDIRAISKRNRLDMLSIPTITLTIPLAMLISKGLVQQLSRIPMIVRILKLMVKQP